MLLLQRDKDDNNGGKWGIAGGHVDNGEEFIDAAQRELQEETGIYVDTDCLKEVGIYDKDGVEIHYFELNLKNDKEIVIQNKEGQDYKWIDIFSDLDKYEMPFDMKDNIYNILGIQKEHKVILKAIESGRLSKELGERLIEKARNHKYIRKVWKNGKWEYIYEEKEGKNELSKEEKRKINKEIKEVKEKLESKKSELENIRKKIENDFMNEGVISKDIDRNSVSFRVAFGQFKYNALDNNIYGYKDVQNDINKLERRKKELSEIKKVDRLDRYEFEKVKNSAINDYKNHIQDNPKYIDFRDGVKKVSKDDYFISTDTVFKGVDLEGKDIFDKWNELKKLGELTHSPKSGSQYIVTKDGVYRLSDHWGICASCYWDFDSNGVNSGQGDWSIGYSPIKDFKINDRYSGYVVLNPKYEDGAKDLIKDSIWNLDLISKSFKLTKTQQKSIDEEKRQLDEEYKLITKKSLLEGTDGNTESEYIKKKKGEKIEKSKEIKELYRKRGVTPPEGKGIHTKEFHDLASKLMQEGMDKDVAYATAMKKLGRDRAVKKEHWDNDVEKARTGIYADNATNRRLKRVGQRYGSSSNNYENENNQPSNNLKENAKNSSDEALRTALKESPDEEVRQAAKEELERRKEDNYGDNYSSKLGNIEKEIISLRRKMSEEEDLGKVEEYNNKMLQLMEDRKNFIKENKSSSNSKDSYGKRIKDIENNILVLKKRLSSEDDLDKIEKYNSDLNKLIEDRRKLKDKYEESKKQDDKVLNIENQILGLRERMSKESDLEKIEQYNDKLLKLIDERKGLLGDKGIEKSEEIIGGLGDNKTVKDIAKKHGVSEEHISKQLEMGIKVEMEHTNDKSKSREIALDHLMESPDYYTKLEKMEESFEDREKK